MALSVATQKLFAPKDGSGLITRDEFSNMQCCRIDLIPRVTAHFCDLTMVPSQSFSEKVANAVAHIEPVQGCL